MPANRKPKAWNLKPQLTAEPELWRGCIVCYPFWERSGNVVNDVSGFGHPGEMINGVSWVFSENGAALKFEEASAQYINIGGNAIGSSLSNEITLSGWLKQDTLFGENAGLITEQFGSDEIVFSLHGNPDGLGGNTFSAGFYGGPWSRATTSDYGQIGKWAHIVGTYDGAVIRLYINGAEVETNSTTAGLPTSTTNTWYIGARHDSPTGSPSVYIDGAIDLPMIHNRALKRREIELLYKDPFAMLRPAGF